MFRRDVEGAGSTHRYTTHIGPLFLSRGDDGFDHIARLEAFDALCPLRSRAGKPELVHATEASELRRGLGKEIAGRVCLWEATI